MHNKSSSFDLCRFSDIREKLPRNCWAYKRNAPDGGIFENETVLYFNENVELEQLNLDTIPATLTGQAVPPVFMMLVEGNLTVSRYIYNEDIDGATGLIVLGDLSATNIAIGGQELYITGDMNIKELFWGDYNHGNLVVHGHINAGVFIATDYSFDVARFINQDRVTVTQGLWFEQEEPDENTLTELLDEGCLVLNTEQTFINRAMVLQYFEQSIPVIKVPPASAPTIPFVFEGYTCNSTNLQRLRTSAVFLDHIPGDATDRTQRVAYWRGDDFKRVQVIKDLPHSTAVYFQQNDKAVIIDQVQQVSGFTRRLFGNKDAYLLRIRVRIIEDDEAPVWQLFNPKLPQHGPFAQLAEAHWKQLLIEWSEIEYWHHQFEQLITIEKIEQILALPFVKEQHSDYYNDAADELWWGSYCWQFRQADEERAVVPRVSIIRSIPGSNGDGYDFYHYDIRQLRNGKHGALLYTQDGNGYEQEPYQVSCANIGKYRNAIRYFKTMEKHIYRLNDDFIAR